MPSFDVVSRTSLEEVDNALQGVARQRQELLEVDGEHGEDGAQLNQHFERPAGTVEAEKVPGKQQVSRGRHGQEFGKTLQNAQDQRHKKTLIGVHLIP